MFLTSDRFEAQNLEKLNLWKNTYMLFGKYTNFEGPFYSEGYLTKKIGIQITRGTDEYVDIDLLAANNDGSWVGIELTTNPKAEKDPKLDRYSSVTPDEIMHRIALNVNDNRSVMLFDTIHLETKYPQVTFTHNSKVFVENTSLIESKSLRSRIEQLNGTIIPISPSLSFTMAPESSKFEVRTALVPIVQQLLTAKIDSISAEEIVENCLTSMFEDISLGDKKGLIKITKSSMHELITDYLPKLLQMNDNRYRRIEKPIAMNSSTFESISDKINSWVHSKKSAQTFLEGFENNG